MEKTGTIFLPTASARALWDCEITGQLSDGMWENTAPHDHWKFWAHCEVAEGEPKLVCEGYNRPVKTGYNIAGLLPHIGDRMLKAGQMGIAGGDERACRGAEYMPATLAEFLECQSTGSWKHDFVRDYMAGVDAEVAEKFYATTYTIKHLRADIKAIKAAMKSVAI